MIFETHVLKGEISNHVESIFYYEGYQPDHGIERVVPTGHLFIIFELDGIPRHTYDNESLKISGMFSNVWISGLHKHYLSISSHKNSEMLVIQFKTRGAYPYFPIPISNLNNKIVNATDILVILF